MITNVYALLDPTTREPRYIGKTVKPIKARLQGHIADARRGGPTYRAKWMRSLDRAPLIQLLAVAHGTAKDGAEAERQVIATLRASGRRLTNLTDGGDGTPGYFPSAETRAKLSASRRGRKASPEHRARISAALTGLRKSPEHVARNAAARRGAKQTPEHVARRAATRVGKKMPPRTPEHAAKLTAVHIGRVASLETRKRMSEAHRGRVHSPETIEKMRQAKLGKKFSAEHCANMGAARCGIPLTPEHRAKTSASLRAFYARKRLETA